MYITIRTALLATLAFIASAAPSSAGYIDLAIGTTNAGGSLTIGPGGIVGTGIAVISAQGQGTLANAGVITAITNGVLNFSTGAQVGTADAAGDLFFANGGSVTITGTVPGFTGTLFSGSLLGTAANPIELVNQGANNFRLVSGGLVGNTAAALGSLYNFDQTASNPGGFSLLLGGLGSTPTVNSGNLAMNTSGSFNPAAGGGAVPEPASLSLLAIGLVGSLAIGRRRRPRAV